MSRSTDGWGRYALLGLFVLLLLVVLALLVGSVVQLVWWQDTTARMGRVVDRAETAVASRGEGVALPPTATSPVTPTSPMGAASLIPLDGGVAITYRSGQGTGRAFYPVDAWEIYKDRDAFEEAWGAAGRLDGPARIMLALIETAQGSGKYHLFRAVTTAEPAPLEPITPTLWSDYTVLVALGEAAEPRLVYTEGETLEIVVTRYFTATQTTVAGNMSEIEGAGADTTLLSNLLLVDNSGGKPVYTLIAFEPDPGAPGDLRGYRCSWSSYRWSWYCRYLYGYNRYGRYY